jgi:VRR-NUC domain
VRRPGVGTCANSGKVPAPNSTTAEVVAAKNAVIACLASTRSPKVGKRPVHFDAQFGRRNRYSGVRHHTQRSNQSAFSAHRRTFKLLKHWSLEPSRELRNHLWAHRAEHIEVARQLISILPAGTLMEILRYLVEHYWSRYAGWPDLLIYRNNDFMLVEVKSARDRLGATQQRWIRDNHDRLHLPFKLLELCAMPDTRR